MNSAQTYKQTVKQWRPYFIASIIALIFSALSAFHGWYDGEFPSEELTEEEEVQQLSKDPSKVPQLRKFLNYYLPTSLKLLNTYAELDAQGINGSNISQSKREIEATMDTLCDAFAAQLDKLFTSDAMDVSADIAAMQAMLAQDGLTDSDFNLPV